MRISGGQGPIKSLSTSSACRHGLNGVWLQVGTEHWRDSHSRQHATANVRDAIPIVGGRGARSKPRIPRPPPERVRVRRPQPRALAPLAPQPHTPFAPLVLARVSAGAELLRASFLPFSAKFHPEFLTDSTRHLKTATGPKASRIRGRNTV